MPDAVGREPQYEVFADAFLDSAAAGFYNAYYDRPACLGLMGDVRGKHVFDAACGPGLYAADLVARGAKVTGCDVSPRMVELARERASRAEFRCHDLADPLEWVGDGCMDLVLMALAIEYIDDRVALLRELRRVLRPDGALVLSRMHPTGDWLRHGGNYFEERVIEETWSAGWRVRYWLAPLQSTCEELYEAGFVIERLLEPRPLAEGAALYPKGYEQLQREPVGFIAIRARPAIGLGQC